MIWPHVACSVLCLAVVPAASFALSLNLPSTARLTAERVSEFDSYLLPVGSYSDGAVPARPYEGRVERRAWRIASGSATTLQTLDPLRSQLEEAGYEILFECAAQICGGFDFRFGTEVVPAPNMHVDIQDFRFVSAAGETGEAASLLVSRSRGTTYIQSIVVTPVARVEPEPATAVTQEETRPVPKPAATPTAEPEQEDGIAARLLAVGHVVLDDLAFSPGGSGLEDRAYSSLEQLAVFLQDNPQGTVVLVGHTDTVGDLASNIRLSKRRAETVRKRLIEVHKVDPARVQAEGNGYLSPIASNLTPEGREANRRVEAILKPK